MQRHNAKFSCRKCLRNQNVLLHRTAAKSGQQDENNMLTDLEGVSFKSSLVGDKLVEERHNKQPAYESCQIDHLQERKISRCLLKMNNYADD